MTDKLDGREAPARRRYQAISHAPGPRWQRRIHPHCPHLERAVYGCAAILRGAAVCRSTAVLTRVRINGPTLVIALYRRFSVWSRRGIVGRPLEPVC
jgi:hypothetical protein